MIARITYMVALCMSWIAGIWLDCAAHWRARGDDEKYRQAKMDLLRRTGLAEILGVGG